MQLTRGQRARIFAGECAPLIFDAEPGCEAGQTLILSWSKVRRYADAEGNAFVPPCQPLVAITVTSVVRRAKGGWAVRFDLIDNRQRKRLVRATPPVYDGDLMARDNLRTLNAEEIARAREESAYTSNPDAALDHLEAVDDEELRRDYDLRRVGETIVRLQRARRAERPIPAGRWVA